MLSLSLCEIVFMSIHGLPSRTQAQISRSAIERLYIAMRHLFIRGSYKPLGISGEAMVEALKTLQPEIYGSLSDPEKIELDGLLYVMQRLPKGIESCRFIKLISREGLENTEFKPIIPPKRRRKCYRVDEEQMYIEMTRGRSDIYDVLTHLTFLYIEAEKIRKNSEDHKGRKTREWLNLEKRVLEGDQTERNKEIDFTYLSSLIGRTFEETKFAAKKFESDQEINDLFTIIYYLGKLSSEEASEDKDREIWFSAALRDRIGHHYYGEQWAKNIHQFLLSKNWFSKNIHIISANPHSVMNCLYAPSAIGKDYPNLGIVSLAEEIIKDRTGTLQSKIKSLASKNGMYELDDTSGTNITVQIFDLSQLPDSNKEIEFNPETTKDTLLIVMDYAFGEQAYETMDELIKPIQTEKGDLSLRVRSISIMGKAGILEGVKGDIMVPNAHIFEGTADNYPFKNELNIKDFDGHANRIYSGPMITVLGTSLQNKDILKYFLESSWKAVGLEMEGAHYQKAIQAASKIRKSIPEDVKLCYAYYASDNPLQTGHTLASGSLGVDGVRPTYNITKVILNKILRS
jgi:hypothetical protein